MLYVESNISSPLAEQVLHSCTETSSEDGRRRLLPVLQIILTTISTGTGPNEI